MAYKVTDVYAMKNMKKLSDKELRKINTRLWQQVKGPAAKEAANARGAYGSKQLTTREEVMSSIGEMLKMTAEKKAMKQGKTPEQKAAIKTMIKQKNKRAWHEWNSLNSVVESARATAEITDFVKDMSDAERQVYARHLESRANHYASVKNPMTGKYDTVRADRYETLAVSIKDGLLFDVGQHTVEELMNELDVDMVSMLVNGLSDEVRKKITEIFQNKQSRGDFFAWVTEVSKVDTPASEEAIIVIKENLDEFCSRYGIELSEEDREQFIINLAKDVSGSWY